MSLKNCHICYIKLKTCFFCELGNHEISREKHRSFREKFLVTKQLRYPLYEIEKFLVFA